MAVRCGTGVGAGACTVVIVQARVRLMKKQEGPRTLRSRPPINAWPDATPSDARLNAASAPKVIVRAKTPVHGGFTQGKGGVQRKHLSVPLCKKTETSPENQRGGNVRLRLRDSGKPPEISFSYIFHSDQCPASAMRRMAFRVFSWEPNAVSRK